MPRTPGTGSVSFGTISTWAGASSNFGSLRGLFGSIPSNGGSISLSQTRNVWFPVTPDAWYDSVTSPIVKDSVSNKVSSWNDKTKNRYHVTQTDVNAQPTYSNTGYDGVRPAVIFGQGHGLVIPASNTGPLASNEELTVFCVAENNPAVIQNFSVSMQFTVNGQLPTNNADRRFALKFNDNNATYSNAVWSGDSWKFGQPTYSGKFLQGFTHGGFSNTSYLMLNNTLPYSVSNLGYMNNIYNTSTHLSIGNNFPSANRNAPKISEVLMYSRALEIHERMSTERYLSERWNLFPLDLAGVNSANLRAAYSARRLRSAYTGPILRLRRASDNTEQDFYSDIYGTLGAEFNGEGMPLIVWANNMIVYVVTIYDQSGNGRNATQTTQANQPSLNLTNYAINFGTNSDRFMTLLNSPFPTGTQNAPYTLIIRHGQINGISSGVFISAGSTSLYRIRTLNGTSYAIGRGNLGVEFTFGTGAFSSTLPRTITYINSSTNNVSGYVDGTFYNSMTLSSYTIDSGTQYFGSTGSGNNINGDIFHTIIYDVALNDTQRKCVEDNLITTTPSERILNSFPTYQRYDANTLRSSSSPYNVSKWPSSHNDGGNNTRDGLGNGTVLPIYANIQGYPEVQFERTNKQFFSMGPPLEYAWMNSNTGITVAVCAKYTNMQGIETLYQTSGTGNTTRLNDTVYVRTSFSSNYNQVYTSNTTFQITNAETDVVTTTAVGGVPDNDWHVFLYSLSVVPNTRSTCTVYVDGIACVTPISASSGANGGPMTNRTINIACLGANITSGFLSFEGSIRDFIVYKTGLSDESAFVVSHALRDKWGLPRRYPPLPLTDAGRGLSVSTTLNDLPYGNGTYYISCSSISNNSLSPVNAFDGSVAARTTNDRWVSANNTYIGSTGLPNVTNAAVTNNVDGTGTVTGEWIQIQLPNAVYPIKFHLIENNLHNAVSLVILGSTDGNTWARLYDNENRMGLQIGANPIVTLEASNISLSLYSYYRYICRRRSYGLPALPAGNTFAALYEFAVYGYGA